LQFLDLIFRKQLGLMEGGSTSRVSRGYTFSTYADYVIQAGDHAFDRRPGALPSASRAHD